MKRACMIGLAAAALAAPAGAQAQTSTATFSGSGRMVAGAVEARITTGRPYSGEAVTERTQVLGDGNRIHVRSTTRVFRDGEGRTRREVVNDDGSVRTISISDPVAHTSYTLDPATKIAYTAGGNVVAPRSSGTFTFSAAPGVAGRARVAERRPATASAGGGGRGRGGVLARVAGPENPNVTKEDLGQQNIEGVMATGTRTTTVIPAGQIGNAQEIRIVSEQWFSDELQALVMTRHNDPRSGENVYRLRSILRAEPDPALFSVPTEYTIQQRGVRTPQ